MKILSFKIRLSLLLFLGTLPFPFSFSLSSFSDSNCSRSFETLANSIDEIPTPIGMTRENLNELIDIFRNNADYKLLDAMVLFGSRTHFTYGYEPTKDSDLDVMFFFKKPKNPLTVLEESEKLNNSLKPLSQKSGIRISQEIPSFLTLKEQVELETKNPPDFARATEVHNRLVQTAKTQEWKRTQLKGEISKETRAMITHRDKIILMRESLDSASFKKQLQNLGYTHIYIIPAGKK